MTKKLFRTLKITCLCMALTAALPIVSFADETTAAVKEDKMVVRIIHLDENGNLLEEDKQTATEETESSEETTDKEEANADEADSDEEEAAEEEADEAEAELEAAIEVENDLRSEIVTYALQFVGNRYKYGGTNPNTGVDCSGFTSYVMRHAAEVELPHSSGGQSRYGPPGKQLRDAPAILSATDPERGSTMLLSTSETDRSYMPPQREPESRFPDGTTAHR